MKILLITEFFPKGKNLAFSGGVEARTYFVGKYLARRHLVYVVCSHQPGAARRESIDGIRVLRVGQTMNYNAGSGKLNLIKLISFIKNAIDIGSKIQPDVIDGGNFIAHTIAKQISLKNNRPAVFWYPDVFIGKWIQTSGVISGLGGWIVEKINLRRGADKIIAISRVTKDKLEKQIDEDVVMIPCGVDKKEFKQYLKKKEEETIICVSRLVKYKRVDDLIWSFSILLKRGIKARLKIVGEGPKEKELKTLVSMLGIKELVSFKKNLPRMTLVKELSSSYLFCLPSEIEGFGISVIEAAAAGIPYVVSDIPTFKEITKGGKGGIICELGNKNKLASGLAKLLTNKSLYKKKSVEAQILAKDYSWAKVAQETENIYKSLL